MFKHVLVAITPEDALVIMEANEKHMAGEVVEPPQVQILHAACYIDKPDEETIEDLYDELSTDETFGLVDEPFILCAPPPSVADMFLNEVNNAMANATFAEGETIIPKRMLN